MGCNWKINLNNAIHVSTSTARLRAKVQVTENEVEHIIISQYAISREHSCGRVLVHQIVGMCGMQGRSYLTDDGQ